MPRRDWSQANEKVLEEGERCRACGSTVRVERAHIWAREADRTPPVGWNEDRDGPWREPYKVAKDRIIPLCGPSTDPRSCHGADHFRRLDLLPLLSVEEQVQAVADAGGIEAAMKRLMPSEQPSKIVPRRLAA